MVIVCEGKGVEGRCGGKRERDRAASSLYRANLGHYSCGGFLELITHEVLGRSLGGGRVESKREGRKEHGW